MLALVVDDSFAIRQILRQYLARLAPGLDVAEAEEPAAARALVQERGPDVVFLDLNLQGMNGASLIDVVARARPDAKIVVATGFHREDPRVVEALSLGAHAYLRKPFQVAEMQALLREFGIVPP